MTAPNGSVAGACTRGSSSPRKARHHTRPPTPASSRTTLTIDHRMLAPVGRLFDQRLVRPVVGVGHLLPGAIRRRRPAGPEEEGGERLASIGIGHDHALHGIGLTQRRERLVAAVEAVVVQGRAPHCFGAIRRDDHGLVGHVHLGAAHLAHEPIAQHRLCGSVERVEACHALGLGPDAQHLGGLAVQPVGRPVRRLVRAVTPDRAELLAAGGLPHLLAGQDVVARHQHAAIGRGDLRGNRRRLSIDIAPEEAEDEERREQRQTEQHPQAPVPGCYIVVVGKGQHDDVNLDESNEDEYENEDE